MTETPDHVITSGDLDRCPDCNSNPLTTDEFHRNKPNTKDEFVQEITCNCGFHGTRHYTVDRIKRIE